MKPIYLDHAATTPIDPEILKGLSERLLSHFGNPSSRHIEGRRAAKLLESARERLARQLGARPEEIIFCSGGTEALSLGILGSAGEAAGEIIISAAEHSAILEAARHLEQHRRWSLKICPVDGEGRLRPETLAPLLSPKTRILGLIWANNEVGTLNDLNPLLRLIRKKSPRAKVVLDAVQALGKLPFKVSRLGVDVLAVTAHKLHGPPGIGALWSRRPVQPLFKGGGQERGQRGGSLSAPLAWAFAEAAALHLQHMPQIRQLRDQLWREISAEIPEAQLLGPSLEGERLGDNLMLLIPGIPSEPLLNALSAAGLMASAGSACARGSFSRTLAAMGRRAEEGAFLRLSPGRFNHPEEIKRAAQIISQESNSLKRYY